MARLRTVALLARVPGLHVLRDALIGNPNVDLLAVYTHGRRPKAEGGGERPELAEYRALCERAGVPLRVLDLPEARVLENHLPAEPFDLLLSLSWRCVLTRAALERPRVAAVNLHRGALPAYAGAEPVRRAIEAGERRVAITAHRMVEEVDAGEVLNAVWLDIDPPPPGTDAAAHAETIKDRLVPLYAPLARRAIAALAPADPAGTRVLLLDLDGTLADSLGVMKRIYFRFMAEVGRAGSDAEFDSLNGPTLDEGVRIMKETHRLDAPLDQLRARYHALADEVYMDVSPDPGARALLESARQRGWRIGVVTSNTEARTRAWLRRAGLDGLIDMVVGGDSVANGKPAPDPYALALRRAGCSPEAALAVEDSAQGAAAALAAGIPTLALARDPNKPVPWPKGAIPVDGLAAVRRRIEA